MTAVSLPASATEEAVLGCAEEPIRTPGAIQPHGVLLAVTAEELRVEVASANAAAVFGRDPLGLHLSELGAFQALLEGLRGDLADVNPLAARIGEQDFDVVVHAAGGLLMMEWEPLRDWGTSPAGADESRDRADWHRRLPRVLQRLSATSGIEELSDVLAADVRELTGFDRVMVYRFDKEWNGEVIAEHARDDLEPFLGLRYPASDIPPQARALYETNWLRIIPDTSYTPVPLVATAMAVDALDLSGAMLRSVSPVHLEYLANMGVASSMSVSLLDQGKLWGLIACHHYRGPHRPSYRDRMAAEFLGRTASLLLGGAVDAAAGERTLQVSARQAQLVSALGRSPRAPLAALVEGDPTVLDLVPADGAAIRIGGRLSLLGETPPEARVEELVPELLATGRSSTDVLSSVLPTAADVVGVASGLLAVPIGHGGDYLAWFRAETLRQVNWGGDPGTSKLVVEGDGRTRLGPRRSFARWSETVRATAQPWEPHEIMAAQAVGSHLTDVLSRRAEEDNRLAAALQRMLLLEALPSISGLDLAARYAPSARDVVGGDWYDLVVLPSGSIAIVLGDVAGHGLGAAAITAQLRHALRAHLLRDAGPAAALQGLNELVMLLLPNEMATAVVAEFDPASGTLALCSAGHLPPLLMSDERCSFLSEGRHPALGLVQSAGYTDFRLNLGATDRLVLYSDGLVERRSEDLEIGLDRLCAAATGSGDAETILERVFSKLRPPDTDDVTVVAFGPAAHS